ncbi:MULTISPECIES: hypothetical protein [Nostocales]
MTGLLEVLIGVAIAQRKLYSAYRPWRKLYSAYRLSTYLYPYTT